MPRSAYPKDSYDAVPATARAGAHRAQQPRLAGPVLYVWAAVAAIILITAGAVGTLALSGRFDAAPPPPTVPAAAATTAPLVDTAYSVVVLNATGDPGQATAVADVIVKAGWPRAKVFPGEAESTYPITTVYYTDAADAAAAQGLAQVVGAKAATLSQEYASTAGGAAQQLTLVLGTDRLPSPSPTP